MASVSSKTHQIADEKLEKLEGEENTVTYSTIVSDDKPESPRDVSVAEETEKSGKIKESETLENIDVDWISSPTTIVEVDVEDLIDKTGIPKEQKRESSDDVVPDASEVTDNDDLNAPTSTEISVNDLEVQSASPEEQKQGEKTTETQDPRSNGATIDCGGEVVQSSSQQENGSGDAKAVQKVGRSLEEVNDNPVETLEAKTELTQNSTDLSAVRAPETAEIVKEEKDIIEKKDIEASVKDLNIVPEASEHLNKEKKVSTNEERMSENLKNVDTTSVKTPKDFTTVEESPQQEIEKTKNESFNDFETLEFTPDVVKDNASSEMVEEKKSGTEDHSLVEKNVRIPDDEKVETQIEEAIQIATEKSEQKELGTEREESQKSKNVDPVVSSDTANTNLIKESTKRKSNNLFSMAKRSIVKVKKAILGKSPGSKTVSSEIKDNS